MRENRSASKRFALFGRGGQNSARQFSRRSPLGASGTGIQRFVNRQHDPDMLEVQMEVTKESFSDTVGGLG